MTLWLLTTLFDEIGVWLSPIIQNLVKDFSLSVPWNTFISKFTANKTCIHFYHRYSISTMHSTSGKLACMDSNWQYAYMWTNTNYFSYGWRTHCCNIETFIYSLLNSTRDWSDIPCVWLPNVTGSVEIMSNSFASFNWSEIVTFSIHLN